nr:MAG TPA: hypothetical protein [Caudoviricetes sp.]
MQTASSTRARRFSLSLKRVRSGGVASQAGSPAGVGVRGIRPR